MEEDASKKDPNLDLCEYCERTDAVYQCSKCNTDDEPMKFCEQCAVVVHQGKLARVHNYVPIVTLQQLQAPFLNVMDLIKQVESVISDKEEQCSQFTKEFNESYDGTCAEVKYVCNELREILNAREALLLSQLNAEKERKSSSCSEHLRFLKSKRAVCQELRESVKETLLLSSADLAQTGKSADENLWRVQIVQKDLMARNLTCVSSFGFVTDASNIKESLMHLHLPLSKDWVVGDRVSVIAVGTVINAEGRFFLQSLPLVTEDPLVQGILVQISQALSLHMNQQQGNLAPSKWEPGMLCCAMYSADEQWHRGVIEKVLGNEKLTVRFIDYGNSTDISPNFVAPLPLQFTLYPYQTRICCFSEDETIDWKKREVRWAFGDCTRDKTLTAEILNRSQKGPEWAPVYVVRLVNDYSVDVGIAVMNAALLPAQGAFPSGTTDIRYLTKRTLSCSPHSSHSSSRSPVRRPFPSSSPSLLDSGGRGLASSTYLVEGKPQVISPAKPQEVTNTTTEEDTVTLLVPPQEGYSSQATPSPTPPMTECSVENLALSQPSETSVTSDGNAMSGTTTRGHREIGGQTDVELESPSGVSNENFYAEKSVELQVVSQSSDDVVHSECKISEETLARPVEVAKDSISPSAEIEPSEEMESSKSGGKPNLTLDIAPPKDEEGGVVVAGDQAPPLHPTVCPDAKLKVHVMTSLDADGGFWSQLDIDQNEDNLYIAQSDQLQEHVANKAAFTPFVYGPGDLCIAQYSEDELWYRAKVVEQKEDGNLDVRFVDYGNKDTVSVQQITPLVSDFRKLPFQAVGCCLALPSKAEFSIEERQEFDNLTYEKEESVTLKVLSVNNDSLQVSLFLADNIDILSKMCPGVDVPEDDQRRLSRLHSFEIPEMALDDSQGLSWAERMDELQSPGFVPGDDSIFFTNSELEKGRGKERERENSQRSKQKGGNHEEEHRSGSSQRQGKNGSAGVQRRRSSREERGNGRKSSSHREKAATVGNKDKSKGKLSHASGHSSGSSSSAPRHKVDTAPITRFLGENIGGDSASSRQVSARSSSSRESCEGKLGVAAGSRRTADSSQSPPMRSPSPPTPRSISPSKSVFKATLLVTNVPTGISSAEVQDHFQMYGEVFLVMSHPKYKDRFYVEMKKEDAVIATRHLNHKPIAKSAPGKKIRIQEV